MVTGTVLAVVAALVIIVAAGGTWLVAGGFKVSRSHQPVAAHHPYHPQGSLSRITALSGWRESTLRVAGLSSTELRRSQFLSHSCPSQIECWIAGGWIPKSQVGKPPDYEPLLLKTTNAGATWIAEQIPRHVYRVPPGSIGGGIIEDISCPDALHCWMVGHTKDFEPPFNPRREPPPIEQPFISATANGGITWKVQTIPKSVWTEKNVWQGMRSRRFPWYGFTWSGLSCPSATACWAVLHFGGGPYGPPSAMRTFVLRTDDAGMHWHVVHRIPRAGGDFRAIQQQLPAKWRAMSFLHVPSAMPAGVLCATPSVCWLQSGYTLTANCGCRKHVYFLWYTVNGGTTWSVSGFGDFSNPPPDPELVGRLFNPELVSCPGSTVCLASASVSPIGCHFSCLNSVAVTAVSTNAGRTWTFEQLTQFPKQLRFTTPEALQCVSPAICAEIVVRYNPRFSSDASVKLLFSTTNGGRTWTKESVPAISSAVILGCLSMHDCWLLGLKHGRYVQYHASG